MTKESMNYISVVSIGLTSIVLLIYVFSKKGKYLGPRMPSEEVDLNGHAIAGKEGQDFSEYETRDCDKYLSSINKP